jgi:hypothetical protein
LSIDRKVAEQLVNREAAAAERNIKYLGSPEGKLFAAKISALSMYNAYTAERARLPLRILAGLTSITKGAVQLLLNTRDVNPLKGSTISGPTR